MTNGFLPDAWRDFFIMIGGAAASLVGLLFVVMSLHIEAIRRHPSYEAQATIQAARNNTYHLLTALVTACCLLVPQPPQLVGAELVAAHLFGLRLPILFTYTHFIRNRAGFPFSMIITISSGYLLGAAAGVALIAGARWGLYLAAASSVIILVRSVLTAWMLMFERRGASAPNLAPPVV